MSAECAEAYTAFWPINEICHLYSDECLTSPQGSWLLPYINLLMDFSPFELAEFPSDGPLHSQGSFVQPQREEENLSCKCVTCILLHTEMCLIIQQIRLNMTEDFFFKVFCHPSYSPCLHTMPAAWVILSLKCNLPRATGPRRTCTEWHSQINSVTYTNEKKICTDSVCIFAFVSLFKSWIYGSQ